MQAEQLRVAARRHRLERARGAAAVAGQLRALGREQQRERLVRRNASRFIGELARRTRVAGANRDQPVRYREVAARAAPRAQVARHEIGRAHDRAHQRPQQDRSDDNRGHRGGQHEHRGFDALALPGNGHVARPLGQPHRGEREHRDDDEIKEDADHWDRPFRVIGGAQRVEDARKTRW